MPMSVPVKRAALYARVSSEKQAECHTIDSQIDAIQARIKTDGLTCEAGLSFCDDGFSGEILERPALERLRDQVAAGAIDRLYVHSPDRLARRYAYVVLLTDEFRRAGVETVFCNQDIARTPEGELLLQVQGVIAEYERAKILERCRRGRRQAAKRGAISALTRAPYGYHYVPKSQAGEARFELRPDQTEIVRQVYEWFVRDRLSIAAITRRLTAAEIPTCKGKNRWSATSVWSILTNPAYQGRARYGRCKHIPQRTRKAALWRPLAKPVMARCPTPIDEQIEIAVPAIITEDVFALAQQQLEENRQRCRLGQRGMRHLLQGLAVCQECGRSLVYHYQGKSSNPAKRCYYRCIATDKARVGGQRLCFSRLIRADLLENTVWDDVRNLLADPTRLEQEFQRRGMEDETATAQTDRPEQRRRQRVQQSISRLIDAYQDGLLSKEEFQPRLQQARQRLATLDQELAAIRRQAQQRDNFQEAITCFRVFAERIQSSLAGADLPTRMKIVRWLIKRIEVDKQEVRIIYRINLLPFEQCRPVGRLQHYSQDLAHGNDHLARRNGHLASFHD